jgi:uncharacterized peroxidase-related enzyme
MSRTYRINLPAVDVSSAPPRVKEPLEGAQKRMGMIPNMYTRMANSPGLLETYLFGDERFRKDSGFSRAEQEVVLLSISAENGCEYCVAAHSTIADTSSKVPREATDAIRSGTTIPDPKLRALAELARAIVVTRGRPTAQDVKAFLDAGYSERQLLEVVLAVSVKTISNYVNHLFETPGGRVLQGARVDGAPAAGGMKGGAGSALGRRL